MNGLYHVIQSSEISGNLTSTVFVAIISVLKLVNIILILHLEDWS